MGENKSIEVNKKLIDLLDGLLSACDWESSLFLKNASKRFIALRAEAERLLQEATGANAAQHTVKEITKAGHRKIFISVYQTEGNNLQKWFATMKSLAEYSISRPVYAEEAHVQALIRSKADPEREGYVVLFVKEDDIIQLPPSRVATDRLGNELLSLKVGAVKRENIIEFVHAQQHYEMDEMGLRLRK